MNHADLIAPEYDLRVRVDELRKELDDAVWNGDEALQHSLTQEINRLVAKVGVGETHEYKF